MGEEKSTNEMKRDTQIRVLVDLSMCNWLKWIMMISARKYALNQSDQPSLSGLMNAVR